MFTRHNASVPWGRRSVLVDAAFTHLGEATQIAIRMDQANGASAAIPRKLGFTLDHEEDHDVLAKGHTGRRFVWIRGRMS